MKEFEIDSQTSLVKGIKYIASPNQCARSKEFIVDLLIIHCISLPPDQFTGTYVQQLFTNKLNPNEHPYFAKISDLKVSAHLFIRRDGNIIQFVPFNNCAWHAGDSEFENRTECNNFSIGIELEGSEHIPYTHEQYEVLIALTFAIRQHYPLITNGRIVGHSDVSPARKSDPGPSFNWDYYRKNLQQLKLSVK